MYNRWNENRKWRLEVTRNLPKKMGVYAIFFAGKPYIGASVNIRRRVGDHLVNMSVSPKHHKLYDVLVKHGENNIRVMVLEIVEDKSKLYERELYWSSKFPNNYNQEKAKRNRTW